MQVQHVRQHVPDGRRRSGCGGGRRRWRGIRTAVSTTTAAAAPGLATAVLGGGGIGGEGGSEDELVGEGLDLLVGLDDGDLDVERRNLVGQRVAEALKRPRCRRVHRHPGRPDVPPDARQHYDVARVLLPQHRQRCLDIVHLREEDRLELVPHQVPRRRRRR